MFHELLSVSRVKKNWFIFFIGKTSSWNSTTEQNPCSSIRLNQTVTLLEAATKISNMRHHTSACGKGVRIFFATTALRMCWNLIQFPTQFISTTFTQVWMWACTFTWIFLTYVKVQRNFPERSPQPPLYKTIFVWHRLLLRPFQCNATPYSETTHILDGWPNRL